MATTQPAPTVPTGDQVRRRSQWQLHPWRAYALIAVVFAVGWGYGGIYSEVAYMTGRMAIDGVTVTRDSALSDIFRTLAEVTAAFTALVVVCRRLGITRADLGCSWPTNAVQWHREAVGFALAPFGPIILEIARSAPGPSPASGAWASAKALVADAVAGPMEEVLLLALVVVLLHRVVRRPWWEVVAAAAVLRWSFHVYYAGQHPGWAELARMSLIVVWPVAVVLWFRSSGRLLGLVIGHSVWDIHVELAELAGRGGGTVNDLLAAATWVVVVVVICRAGFTIDKAQKLSPLQMRRHVVWRRALALGEV